MDPPEFLRLPAKDVGGIVGIFDIISSVATSTPVVFRAGSRQIFDRRWRKTSKGVNIIITHTTPATIPIVVLFARIFPSPELGWPLKVEVEVGKTISTVITVLVVIAVDEGSCTEVYACEAT